VDEEDRTNGRQKSKKGKLIDIKEDS